MNKKVLFFIFLLAVLQACQTPSKLVQQGRYEAAIAKLVVKVNKVNPKAKDVALLKQAFHVANQKDHDAIKLLKASGEPDVWPKIFDAYQDMANRQQAVKALPESVKSAIHFVSIDLSTDFAVAKVKAQDYLYAKALQLVESKNKADSRQALEVLDELRAIAPNYNNINELQRLALLQATNRVLLVYKNHTRISLPVEFERELMRFSASGLDEKFIQYDVERDRSTNYDFVIEVGLEKINVSPEKVDRRSYTDKKEVQDGMQPKRDKDGNILLDSTGKVLEEPKFRIIEALVSETALAKDVVLTASVDFYDDQTGRLLLRSPVEVRSFFTHGFAMVNGDLKAISPATRELMRNGPAPFPSDEAMVMDAVKQLNREVEAVIKREKRLLRKNL